MRRHIRSTFATLALLTACLAPPALTRAERNALVKALRDEQRVEERTHEQDGQSHEAFAFIVLGTNYEWKIVVATLCVPLTVSV